MERQAIRVDGAAAVGPYSHAVRAGEFLYLSGQTPLNPATGKLLGGGVKEQARQCFHNLFKVLEAASMGPGNVVKVNVFLTNMEDFADMNEVYASQFEKPYPARTTIGVAALPLGARIEIEMVARKE